jgi:D-alanyl-D-alanine endopeptidase (penicillin-binding protein 7)
MNQMATHLGLTNSRYADPSGLDARNVSSAYDISHLIAFASSDDRLGPIMRTEAYDVRTNRRSIPIHSTNRLLGIPDVDVVAGKTGFISKAGYCLATLLKTPQGAQVAVVVLGAANSTFRFWDARHLFNWAADRTRGLISAVPVPLVQTQE